MLRKPQFKIYTTCLAVSGLWYAQ
jgi:hypothetical protein